MNSSDATVIAAWWGAGVATVVLVWDVFKWWRSSAANIRIGAKPNTQEIVGEIQEGDFLYIEVANVGDKKTTITHPVGFVYRSWWHKLFRRESEAFIVMDAKSPPLPAELEPGDRWGAYIGQTEQLKDWSRNERLYVGIHHSLSRSPKLVRVVIPPREN